VNPRSGSDRRGIAASVSERLSNSPYFRLRTVWCDYHEGVLCLRGRVPTYYLKQVAQTIACQVEGVEECMNRIEVGPNSPPEKTGAEKSGN
jgi:osmotically-inducible protein OsmY